MSLVKNINVLQWTKKIKFQTNTNLGPDHPPRFPGQSEAASGVVTEGLILLLPEVMGIQNNLFKAENQARFIQNYLFIFY